MSPQSPPITLNPQQQAALQAMITFLQQGGSFFLLKGYAGTGKTTLTQLLIQRCDRVRIALTASTHKAAQALMSTARHWGNDHLEAMTIHRLLGLVVRQQQGQKRLVQEGHSKLNQFDLVLVDECSMINQELFEILKQEAQANRAQFILIGDPAQLPPVGEPESLSFSITPCAELTQVMRLTGGNPIGPVLDQIREQLDQPQASPQITELIQDNHQGIACFQDRDRFLQMALKAFQAAQADEDGDRVRVLAWTNKVVGQINRYVRRQLYGAEVPRFLEGERLVAKDTIVDPMTGKILLNSCGEVTVERVEIGEAHGYQAWLLEVITEEELRLKLPVLHEDALQRFQQEQQLTLSLALETNQAAKQDPSKSNRIAQQRAWEAVERQSSLFALLDYSYALTVHKAQGSQFRNVFVVERDLRRNPNIRERNQLRYVAYSRAMDRLFILS